MNQTLDGAGKFAGGLKSSGKSQFFPSGGANSSAYGVGFRFGHVGTHTSRTLMLSELETTLAGLPDDAQRSSYMSAIVDENCLHKATVSTRRLTGQRLSELYALNPAVPIFRVLRRLWSVAAKSHPLLALLCALARDPMLAATASSVVPLPPGAEFQRGSMRTALRSLVSDRLSDSTLDKVVRNAASTWAQSGHLKGRTFKIRQHVTATPVAVAFALYLGQAAGFTGEEMLKSGWVKVLDCGPTTARELALEAKRMGLVDLRTAGDVFELDLERLDPRSPRR